MAPVSMFPVPARAQQRWTLLAVCLAALALPLSFSAGAGCGAGAGAFRGGIAHPRLGDQRLHAHLRQPASRQADWPIVMAGGGCSCWARWASPRHGRGSVLSRAAVVGSGARIAGRGGCSGVGIWHGAAGTIGRGRRVPVSSPCWAPRSAWGWRWGPCSRACCCRHWDGAACSPRAVCSRWWPRPGARAVPESHGERRPLDIGGMLSFSLTLAALTLALLWLGEFGLHAVRVQLALLATLLLGGVFVTIERRHPSPLLDSHCSRNRRSSVSSCCRWRPASATWCCWSCYLCNCWACMARARRWWDCRCWRCPRRC